MNDMKTSFSKNKLYAPIIVSLVLIGLAFLGLTTASILRNRNNYIYESRIKSEVQAQLLGENTAGVMYTVDFLLLSICSMIKSQSDYSTVPQSSIDEYIKIQTRFLPQIRNVFFLNSEADTVFATGELKNFKLASFVEHRDAWLDFSMETIFMDGEKGTMLLSRRVEKRNGEFLGVLVAMIDSSFFYDRFDDYLNLDANAIVLFDSNGNTLASWYNHLDSGERVMTSNIQSIPEFSQIFQNNMIYGGRKTYEDDDAILSVYQITGFPYHVAVMHTKKNILQKWYGETKNDLSIMGVTFIMALCTIALAIWQRQGRKIAEFQLFEHQRNLEETVRQRTKQIDSANSVLLEKNVELENALAKVKTLSGLLPICSHCKKIRDDKGYWNTIEGYIHEHSGAEFSHSICQECAKQYYPDYDLYED